MWQDSVNVNWNVCALYGTLWEPKILIQMLWARPLISGSFCCIKIVIYYQESICWWFSWFSSAVCLTVILPLQGENMAVNHSRNFKEPLCTVQIHVTLYLGIVVRFWYQMLWSSQNYVEQLLEHRCIVLCGQQGLGKSYLAAKLAEHVVQRWVVDWFWTNLGVDKLTFKGGCGWSGNCMNFFSPFHGQAFFLSFSFFGRGRG